MMRLSFKSLKIWQKGIELVDSVYESTEIFPKKELYGLISQMNRSAVSIPSNIAEGSQRTSDKDFANFVLIAKGSLAELYTQIIIAKQRRYLTEEQAEKIFKQIDELDRMLYAFYAKLTVHR